MTTQIVLFLLFQVVTTVFGICAPCGSNYCYYKSPNGQSICHFINNNYPDPNACFPLTCRKIGSCAIWYPKSMNPKPKSTCSMCRVCNDPHFNTFDNKNYDFHGTCNYTLTQKIPALTNMNPDYGVFSQFRPNCVSNSAITCMKTTVFRDNPNTVITVQQHPFSFNFKINTANQCSDHPNAGPVCSSSTTFHPVYFWKYGSSLWFQGTQFTVQIQGGCTRIWAHKTVHFNKLAGLCGKMNSNQADDLTDRNNVVQASPNTFGNSWKASNAFCPPKLPNSPNPPNLQRTAAALVQAPCREYNQNVVLCKSKIPQGSLNAIDYKALIHNCATDLCNDPKNKDYWLKFNGEVIRQEQKFLPTKPCANFYKYFWICVRKLSPKPTAMSIRDFITKLRECAMEMCENEGDKKLPDFPRLKSG